MKYLYDKKIKSNTDFNIWMAFPGNKTFALSALGFMFLCKSFDLMECVNFEPIYLDTKKTSIMSKDVNLMGFSFAFDMDFLSILTILDQHNIPKKSSERNENHPFVFGGGPVLTTNPEPYYEIFDFVIIGDGEDIINDIVKICRENREKSRKDVLKLLSELDGIYVPTLNQKQVKKLNIIKYKMFVLYEM